MSTLKEMLVLLRKKAGLSQQELADRLEISRSTVGMYETGRRQPDLETLEAIADLYKVDINTIMGRGADFSPGAAPAGEGLVRFPIIASVRAGFDREAIEDTAGDYEMIPREALRGHAPAEYRVLRVNGNSMYPQLLDGDRVLVHVQPSVDSGDIVVMLYNGDDSTIKKVRYVTGEDWLELIPANPEYQTRRIEGSDLEQCRVFGKVILLLRDLG